MVKIVNGHIVAEDAAPKSPLVILKTDRPRRGSIQELQMAEQLREQKASQEISQPVTVEHPPPTWRECVNEKVSVFGVMLAVKHLALIALLSIVTYGIQGLLVCLLGVYIGTLYKPKTPEALSAQPPEPIEQTQGDNASPKLSTRSPLVTKRRFSTLSDLSVQSSA